MFQRVKIDIETIQKSSIKIEEQKAASQRASEKHISQIQNNINKANEILEYFIEQRKNYDKLIGVITTDKVSDKFNSSATINRIVSEFFRIAAIVFMIAAVFILVDPIYPKFFLAPQTLVDFLIRMSSSISLGVVAAYFAKQASIHRDRSFKFRQFTLDSYALKPLIANLSQDTQNKITENIALSYFFRSSESSQHREKDAPAESFAVMKQFAEVVDKIVKINSQKP